jgi:putative FmdB family regulatory protein
MPLYEYECTACHRHTEKIQKFSDPEITVCPHCGGELKRVISAPAFSLKGGGWYKDGYGNAKPAAAASGDSTPAASAPASSEGGSSTPAATPAPAAAPAAAPSSDKK